MSRFRATVTLVAALVFVALSRVSAQPGSPGPLSGPTDAANGGSAASNPAGEKALTAQDAETWLDGYMPYAMGRGGIPGAVIVIVKDGKVLLEKGYGVSDAVASTPVDPYRTLFRLGSVSKLFTWTAVMQLVEQGKIDLDVDVNTYLDFKIPPLEGRPVTMRNIMTHTAGFEEAHRGIATLDPRAIVPLGDALKRWTPERVYAPGSTPAYSNYAAAVAGYIVQRVSGEPFDDYIAEHILSPLRMKHSTFTQPLPAALAKHMAKGYPKAGAKAGAYELVIWKPAGSMAATADDMSRFMMAHLQNGAYGDMRILSATTAGKMHTTALTIMPSLNRMELGFYEQNINGRSVIAHDGDTVLFHSLLALYTGENVGLFASFDSPGAGGAVNGIRQQLFERFSDRYFPNVAPPDGLLDPAMARAHANMFADAYLNSRSSHSTFIAATNLLTAIRVIRNSDGTVSLSALKSLDGDRKRFREISPFLWRQVDGHDRLAGVVRNGQIVRISTDEVSPIMVFDAIPAWRSPVLLAPAFGLGLIVFILEVVLWPIVAIVRRRYGATYPYRGERARAQTLMRSTAAVAVVAVLGWLLWLSTIMSPMGIYVLADQEALIYLTELLSIIGFGGAFLASLYNTLVVWRTSTGWLTRLWGAVIFLSAAALLYTGSVYHLLKLSTQF